MPKQRKVGRKSQMWTRAQIAGIKALAIAAVRADWDAEHVRLNPKAVETPGLSVLQQDLATHGTCFPAEVDRAIATFGEAERTDPSEVIRRMQRERGDRRGYVHLTCTRPNPEQIAEGIAAAADFHLSQTDPAGGGGQTPPAPTSPAPPAAFDAAVAANKAIFSLREAAPSEKNKITEQEFLAAWRNCRSPSSDTTSDGTQSGETAPAKNEKFWGSPVDKAGPLHAWSAAAPPTWEDGCLGDDDPPTDELERAMLDDGMIEWAFAPRAPGSAPGFLGGLSPEQRAAALAHRGEDVPEARVPICAGGVWLTASWSRGEVVCSVCGQSRLLHPPAAEKTDSPPANTHLGTMPGGRPLGRPKVNDPRLWWETIMADVEALPRGNQITLSPWQVRHLYDALHAWGYRSGRRTP